jgi:hypothetical protein
MFSLNLSSVNDATNLPSAANSCDVRATEGTKSLSMAVSSWLTLKPSSLRSIIWPIVIPKIVMVTLPAGITDLVVMMIKSCFPRFVVMGALGLLKANETAGWRHQPPEPQINFSGEEPWITSQGKQMRRIAVEIVKEMRHSNAGGIPG